MNSKYRRQREEEGGDIPANELYIANRTEAAYIALDFRSTAHAHNIDWIKE